MKKYIYISLLTFTMALTACSSLDESGVADAIAVDGQNIRMHATIKSGTRIDVPSDNKTDWENGDNIFMILDGGNADQGFKATYDGSTWNFAEWFKNGKTPEFKPEGGTVTFAIYGENLDLSTDKPSNYAPTKTTARLLPNYTGGRSKLGDIMSTFSGTYTVDKNGVVDIFLDFERPMAKIHIIGAYIGAAKIRNHIEGTIPGGRDNADGTVENYNKSKMMTLNEVIRYMPKTKEFRNQANGANLDGTSNMVYTSRPEDAQIIDAVYYGTMQPDDNGDLTIVMCSNAGTYKGIQGNAEATGTNQQTAYWRKFPGKSINPGDNIYIYGPMSEEEATLWTSQGINGEMNFTQTSLTLAENQQVNFKPYCKWKAPAPSDRSLTFEISDPNVVTLSEDKKTLYTHGTGTSTITATTASGYKSTMTVSVKEVQELVDVKLSQWGTSFSSTYNVGWRFLNNTVVDLVITRVAMMVDDQEIVSQGGLSLLARANNGSAAGELRVKEENVTKLPTSILRITYTYNGNEYSIDVPFSNP